MQCCSCGVGEVAPDGVPSRACKASGGSCILERFDVRALSVQQICNSREGFQRVGIGNNAVLVAMVRMPWPASGATARHAPWVRASCGSMSGLCGWCSSGAAFLGEARRGGSARACDASARISYTVEPKYSRALFTHFSARTACSRRGRLGEEWPSLGACCRPWSWRRASAGVHAWGCLRRSSSARFGLEYAWAVRGWQVPALCESGRAGAALVGPWWPTRHVFCGDGDEPPLGGLG